MVSNDEWPQVAQGLIECGLCEVMDEKELFHVKGQPLKNGLFAVSKDEFAVPDRLLPKGVAPGRGFLVARVLPMGYANSVAVAQYVHRRVVRQCMGSMHPPVGAEQESRRDKFATSSSSVFRVYLDNFDFLEKLESSEAEVRKGKVSPVVEELRRAYELQGLPRHPKKATEQQWLAEVQGALVDGQRGVISAKPAKVAKYIAMTLELLKHGRASQRELQVVGGGLVYLCMFKRPLLCGLNKLWKVIVGLEGAPRSWKVPLCKELTVELVRFLALLPLAYINLRAGFAKEVTASDASLQGGGAYVSKGLTPYGVAASRATIRGDLPEKHDFVQVLTVGLFDGIGAFRVAADILGLPLAGHVAVECSPTAQHVMEANFSEVIQVSQVEEVDEEAVRGWSLRFSSVGLVLVGAGPPCQGVSGLNSDRRGALKDVRSCLFQHVPRITSLIKKYFVWVQVHDLVESVASMDCKDCVTMSNSLGTSPWFIDSCGMSLAHRPRVYWVSWELYEEQGVIIRYGSDGRLPIYKVSTKTAPLDCKLVQKLCGLVLLKGQDLLLQQQSAQPVRSQRLRASLPSKLWRWANIAGWQWTGDKEHINVLELRAAYTTIRYRVEVLRQWDVRFVHLLDSMVVLHGLTRGRSSSRKMKRTLMRLNSLLLVTGLQATWAYVDTKENPADKPSRWGVKKRWLKVKHRN
eukprot:Skav214216  [mRNA]  locus=scaffold489:495523:498308:- [translate_table: standard]